MRLLIFELLKLRFNKNFSITKIFFYLQIKFFYIWFIYIYTYNATHNKKIRNFS